MIFPFTATLIIDFPIIFYISPFPHDFPAGTIQTHRVAGRQVASNNATRYAEPPWFGRCNCLAL